MDTRGYDADAVVSVDQLYTGGKKAEKLDLPIIAVIEASMRKIGWYSRPINVHNKPGGGIYLVDDGHHRVCAAARVGISVPVIFVGEWNGSGGYGQYWHNV